MNKLKRYTILGFLFVSITGSISHFVYEWSGNNLILGLFFPVNESTWEHMKLSFFPMTLYSFIMEKKLKKEYPCITSALPFGIITATFLIPAFFYTYSGILGQHFLVLDIAVFLASVLVAFITVYRLALSCSLSSYATTLKLLAGILAACFLCFTYHAPDLGIFMIPGK